jgi:UDP-N-acetylglucosamine 2-epimerase
VAAKRQFVSVVGARPQFVKLAPICQAFAGLDAVQHHIVHTGQHYDATMSKVFFEELAIPAPDTNLNVGSGGHGEQTGRMLSELEALFNKTTPDAVIVYGDTNSTLAACLAAVKLHLPVAHVEAGLRSFNRAMPEEINRVATDHCADRLYAPTPTGLQNLTNENLQQRSVFSGDVMRDTVIRNLAIAGQRGAGRYASDERYGVLTLHRPVNTDPDVLPALLHELDAIAQRTMPLLFPVHPRIRLVVEGCQSSFKALRAVEPLAYLDMLVAVKHAGLVITDSGGLQKEAAFVDTPCVTLRDETEWTETVDIGVNVLSGTGSSEIEASVSAALEVAFDDNVARALDQHFGSGTAAKTIVEDLVDHF